MANEIDRIAWTGGSRPKPWGDISPEEKRFVGTLFNEQRKLWEDFWKEKLPRDLRNLFWGRARYDAHATFRNHVREHFNG